MLVVEPSGHQTIDRETLLGALRGRVPDWWLPERIVLVEKMPLAATGKIDKKHLRAQFAAG